MKRLFLKRRIGGVRPASDGKPCQGIQQPALQFGSWLSREPPSGRDRDLDIQDIVQVGEDFLGEERIRGAEGHSIAQSLQFREEKCHRVRGNG